MPSNPVTLDRFPQGFRAAVFGASGGIGGAMARHLAASPRCGRLYAGARRGVELPPGPVTEFAFDLEDEASIAAASASIAAAGPLHLVIVATGVLHGGGLAPEKTWRSLEAGAMARAFAVNTIGPALIAKHTLGALARGEHAVFAALSARVGSITGNRLGGWHSYRASKAALNMLIRNFAIELNQRNPSAVAIALHPGTVDTPLSKPFQGAVPADGLFTADDSAARLLNVINAISPDNSGCLHDWDGKAVEF